VGAIIYRDREKEKKKKRKGRGDAAGSVVFTSGLDRLTGRKMWGFSVLRRRKGKEKEALASLYFSPDTDERKRGRLLYASTEKKKGGKKRKGGEHGN